jgi:hypothetical protein
MKRCHSVWSTRPLKDALPAPRLSHDLDAGRFPFMPFTASKSILRHPAVIDRRQAFSAALTGAILYRL